MATSKEPAKAPATRKASAKVSARASRSGAAAGEIRPIKESFTKAALVTHVAEQAGVEPRVARAVLAALEQTIMGALHKKGAGEFSLPGLVKIAAQTVPAKGRRFGKDPFTGAERWFEAKPASVRIKVRALKKLKDAAG